MKQVTEDYQTTRRGFAYSILGGISGFLSGVSATGKQTEIYDDLNRSANGLIYSLLDAGNKDREKAYRKAHHRSLDRAVIDQPVKVNMVDVNFDHQKRDHGFDTKTGMADSIENTFDSQLSLDVDVEVRELEAEQLDTDLPEDRLFDQLQDVKWRTKEGREFMGGKVLTEYLSDWNLSDSINIYLIPFDSSYFHVRAGGFENKIAVDKRRLEVVETLLYHDIGHSLGLFHDEESIGVMSYSPDRVVRGELGLIEEPFRKESKENWEWIKEYHRMMNPELEHFDA